MVHCKNCEETIVLRDSNANFGEKREDDVASRHGFGEKNELERR